ncbi:MAG: GNAT family N-acetyltransferase [Candidatus Korarchaeota archaeon]|nr:GNAT family N-acetyltransferase [Candidatus Korarchaeota archaeon]NIU84981.1 GNAT family N-acetyltransferase [Candidatus Thorarchaeota archaeon]NIW15003.1 GNAT family N-acetyltransferase [Candidatus Thorarchaeota archaeon]NIW53013.1 GNAT family N-acetyltransferase [Candidatus Korarchaeota archaeon]
MKIRELKMKDYEQVYELWSAAGIELKKSDERPGIQRMINRNPKTCLVGVKNGEIVAAVLGGFDGRRGFIHHMAVKPSHQGEGLGSKLLKELLMRFKKQRVIKLHLFVQKENKEVIGFYKDHGFVKRTELIDLSKKLID